MSEWKKYKFSQFVDINPKVTFENKSQLPFVEMKDLESANKFCTFSKRRQLSGGSRFENEDTLFARITPCLENGKIAQVRNLPGGKGFGSTEFLVLRGRTKISSSDFVYYVSRWREVRDFAEMNLHGTSGRQRFPSEAFEELELSLPPLPVQEAIAEVLNSLDDKIDLLHRNNKTLEELAQTLFRQWFVGEVEPKVRLGDYVKTTSGGTPRRDTGEFYSGGIIPWVKSKELNGTFVLDTEEHITESGLSNSSAKRLPKNTILVAMYGATVGEYGVLSTEATCNQAICALIPNHQYPYTFLFSFVSYAKENIINAAVGSAQQNVSQFLIQELEVPRPSSKVLSFHQNVEPLFDKILVNLKQIRSLQTLRDTLLPKLMSGEVKVQLEKG